MRTAVFLISSLCGGLCACNRERAVSEPALTPAARRAPDHGRASAAIAEARCERAVRCETANGVEQFEDRDACMDAMLGDGQAELSRCRQRVDLERVRACLAGIEALQCEGGRGNVGLGGIEPCEASALCPPDEGSLESAAEPGAASRIQAGAPGAA